MCQISREIAILTPEEVAQFLRKSVSWVYKNSRLLGGRKLGGSLFFPRKEDLYERLFCQRQGMEIRFHTEAREIHRGMVQNKRAGQNGRGGKKGGDTKS